MSLGLVALAALILSGCHYLLDDVYGNYLQYAEAQADLRDEFGASLDLDTIEGMSIAATGSKTLLFVEALDREGASLVRALDPLSLSLDAFSADAPASTFGAASDANAEFVIGTKAFFPSTMSVDIAASPAEGILVADVAAGRNYLFPAAEAPSPTLRFRSYDASWGGSVELSRPFSSGGESWIVARATVLGDGRFALIAFAGSSGKGIARAAAYPSVADFVASASPALAASPISLDSSLGGIGSRAGLSAWATTDGAVAIESDSGGRIRLARYGYGDGLEKDGFELSSRQDMRFYFEPSGRYWYLFERGSGRLYRLRTWWPR
jgi:hypothetical protein